MKKKTDFERWLMRKRCYELLSFIVSIVIGLALFAVKVVIVLLILMAALSLLGYTL